MAGVVLWIFKNNPLNVLPNGHVGQTPLLEMLNIKSGVKIRVHQEYCESQWFIIVPDITVRILKDSTHPEPLSIHAAAIWPKIC